MQPQTISFRIIMLVLCTGILFGCTKSSAPDTVGGKGGSATLLITPQCHGVNVDSCTIYIKYNASDLPVTFDDSIRCRLAGGIPIATFGNLKKGNYYLFGRGWAVSLGQMTSGGRPYTITEEKDQSLYLSLAAGG